MTARARLLVAVAAALVAGFGAGRWAPRSPGGGRSGEPPFSELRAASRYPLIHPLLICEGAEALFKDLLPEKGDVRALLDRRRRDGSITDAAVYYRDLGEGPWFGINEEARFEPASLLKVPVLMAYLKRAETDKKLLQRQVVYRRAASAPPQLVPPARALVAGRRYSIDELLRQMIVRSDNDAMRVLVERLPGDDLEALFKALHVGVPAGTGAGYTLAIHEYTSFFRVLFNASYLSQEMSQRALALLAESEFKDGLAGGVPADVTVAHKFGERARAGGRLELHDCGIVYFPNNPYILCVMTEGDSLPRMSAAIRDVSALVYRQAQEQASAAGFLGLSASRRRDTAGL